VILIFESPTRCDAARIGGGRIVGAGEIAHTHQVSPKDHEWNGCESKWY
jgi:hypothetical protein